MTGHEPTVQVPVSLIEDMPHEDWCAARRFPRERCDCWKARLVALLSQPTPTADDRDAWHAAVQAKRAEQRAKGYTAEHDRQHGIKHLLLWAHDYASRGRHLDAAALVEAAMEVLLWQQTVKSDYDVIRDARR